MKYVLPNVWNLEKKYQLEMVDNDGFSTGKVYLGIQLDNNKNKEKEKIQEEVQLLKKQY